MTLTGQTKILFALGATIYFAATAYFVIFQFNATSSRLTAKQPAGQDCIIVVQEPISKPTTRPSPSVAIVDGTHSEEDVRDFEALAAAWKGKSYAGVDEYIFYHTARLGLEALPDSMPLRPELGPVINDVNFRYPINVPPCKDNQHFVVTVITSTKNFERRQLVRLGWTDHLNASASYAFFMGRTENATIQQWIEEESATYGDIIQIDMIDTYFNLSMKVAALLNWVNTYCPVVPFVLKADDDVYVNVDNLAAILPNLPAGEPSIYGGMTSRAVLRTNDTVWYSSYEMWPWSSYPPYLSGGSVLISGPAIPLLLAATQVTPYYFIDDLYFTGLVAKKAGVSLRLSDKIFVVGSGNVTEMTDPCYISRYVTWISHTTEHMKASRNATEMYYGPNGKRCFVRTESEGEGSPGMVQERPDPVVMDLSLQVDGDVFIRLNND